MSELPRIAPSSSTRPVRPSAKQSDARRRPPPQKRRRDAEEAEATDTAEVDADAEPGSPSADGCDRPGRIDLRV